MIRDDNGLPQSDLDRQATANNITPSLGTNHGDLPVSDTAQKEDLP